MLILIFNQLSYNVDEETENYLNVINNDNAYLINTGLQGAIYISNNKCTICGYQEKWLMECGHCQQIANDVDRATTDEEESESST